jgi:hypothetical protein
MLNTLKRNADEARAHFETLVASNHPGCDKWDWYRALDHAGPNPIGHPNEDTSRDAALAGDLDLASTHDAYISALHIYYRARDGEHGVLGGV